MSKILVCFILVLSSPFAYGGKGKKEVANQNQTTSEQTQKKKDFLKTITTPIFLTSAVVGIVTTGVVFEASDSNDVLAVGVGGAAILVCEKTLRLISSKLKKKN